MWVYLEIAKQAMCSEGNTVSFSRNVDTFSAILTAWHHFIRSECFYGDLMSPSTIKYTLVFT